MKKINNNNSCVVANDVLSYFVMRTIINNKKEIIYTINKQKGVKV